ncbi:hypothetical protein ES705_37210 [subsurface metagenome]
MEEATYTKVENYLIHALCRVGGTQKKKNARTGISLGILQTVLAICRLTVGFHIPTRALTYEQISRITGFTREKQGVYMRQALKLNMITRFDSRGESEIGRRPSYHYAVNFDPLTWDVPMRFPIRHFGAVKKEAKVETNKGLKLRPIKVSKVETIKGLNILGNVLKEPWRFG